MPNRPSAPRLPAAAALDAHEIARFEPFAVIQDADGFLRALNELLAERVSRPMRSRDTAREDLRPRAGAKEPHMATAMAATEIQRRRQRELAEFNDLANLPLARYARLANVSRQHIYKEVKASRLLAITLGERGRRVPDWQLDPQKQRLTRAVLARAGGKVDAWTVFRFLRVPHSALGNLSPLQVVHPDRIGEIVDLAAADFAGSTAHFADIT